MRDLIQPSCRIDHLSSRYDFRATVDVLRLDRTHPVVSGNKWFKLKEYVAGAKEQEKILLTIGGAFSNHMVATAAAAQHLGLQSIGVIRGEEAVSLSHTLQQAKTYGMKLFFTTREAYRHKNIPAAVFDLYPQERLSIIPEGGYGAKGMEGAKDILREHNTAAYTHILTAVGTGTTLAGLAAAATTEQSVIGISVLKNAVSLNDEIRSLLPVERRNKFALFHDYHFGGYAKHTTELLRFMNDFYRQTGIPTEFVYTGKAFFAAFDRLRQGFFPDDSRLLLVHTGGLQGNRSLKKGTLIFG